MLVVSLETRERVFAGILFASLSYFLFTVHDAVVKLLVVAIPVWQVLFFRSVTILAGCLIVGGRPIFAEAARSPIVKPMFLRSFLIMAAWLCYYTAARDLQLAELTTIYYAAPIIVTVLSYCCSRRRYRWSAGAAVAVGFLGVYIACDPAGLGISRPVLLVLAAALMWGLSIVLMRKIASQAKSIVQMILSNSFFLVAAGPAADLSLENAVVAGGRSSDRRRGARRLCPVHVVRRHEARAGLGDRALRIHRSGVVVPARLPDLA